MVNYHFKYGVKYASAHKALEFIKKNYRMGPVTFHTTEISDHGEDRLTSLAPTGKSNLYNCKQKEKEVFALQWNKKFKKGIK